MLLLARRPSTQRNCEAVKIRVEAETRQWPPVRASRVETTEFEFFRCFRVVKNEFVKSVCTIDQTFRRKEYYASERLCVSAIRSVWLE